MEGHLMPDHVHMFISISPKYAVAQVVGFIKGKSAIHIARTYGGRKKNFVGEHFWARGYYVSTAGKDEEGVREVVTDATKPFDWKDEFPPDIRLSSELAKKTKEKWGWLWK